MLGRGRVGKVFQLPTPSSDHLANSPPSLPQHPSPGPGPRQPPRPLTQRHKEVLIASLHVIKLDLHYFECRIHNVPLKGIGNKV